MNITVTVNPLEVMGLIICAYLSGLVGNVLGLFVVGFVTPSAEGRNLYTVAMLLLTMFYMTPVKLFISLLSALICIHYYPTVYAAATTVMAITAFIGFCFTASFGIPASKR